MKIEAEHKSLLRGMGLAEKDFERFDGQYVRYEHDPQKGVRLYDPYYLTSYSEYIDSEGWSSWSSEGDTFMSDILRPAQEEARRRAAENPRPSDEDLQEQMKKKFGTRKREE